MAELPHITFGMIVLNGEPFIRYNLRALYPFAHQIIVVEGAAPAAANIATSQGHSTDTTLETLWDFKKYEDPDDKLTIVTAEDEEYSNGFWPGEKHEMSRAYAKRATGDYIWQVDADEFYRPNDMKSMLHMLHNSPGVTAVSFKMINFWGSFDYIVDGWYLLQGANIFHRLFEWRPGYQYVTHRPPTVLNKMGRDLRDLNWIDGTTTAQKGIYLYHYSLLFPKQVLEKCEYYGTAKWIKRERAQQWAEESFIQLESPFYVHNVYDHPSWLERFTGIHPPQIEAMQRDIASGRIDIKMRPTEDVERLLRSLRYRMGRIWLKALYHWKSRWNGPWKPYLQSAKRLLKLPFQGIQETVNLLDKWSGK